MSNNEPPWRRSSYCEANACVEILMEGDRVWLRDAKDPNGASLTFSASEWRSFVAGVRAGEFVLNG
jgi:hypothetical protein